ncbi:nuclear transport factor 2 family protein [Tropicimonas sp. TH_r6]|uniref:YybH family protein n=1 Tax=Tropicimonas sp. TH_r6 TaxID=3082085 RepID=UPI0029533027|nr:nuclear transport factor 2 family protein [Tropicimonas sp. TH_r6]MDV7145671.1 nuclear transport factor 2 family protein [Tropicimonas sp. TH_r6]
MKTGILACSAMVLSMVLSPPAFADEASDRAEILEIWDRYEDTRMAGDAEGWLALWDEDGIQVPLERPPRDKDRLAEIARKAFVAIDATDFEIRSEEEIIAGDWAWSRGDYSMILNLQGVDLAREGNFLTIFRRQSDGSWRIFRETITPFDDVKH